MEGFSHQPWINYTSIEDVPDRIKAQTHGKRSQETIFAEESGQPQVERIVSDKVRQELCQEQHGGGQLTVGDVFILGIRKAGN